MIDLIIALVFMLDLFVAFLLLIVAVNFIIDVVLLAMRSVWELMVVVIEPWHRLVV